MEKKECIYLTIPTATPNHIKDKGIPIESRMTS